MVWVCQPNKQIEIICDFSPIKKGRTIIKSPWARLHDESEDWVQNASEESWVDWFLGKQGNTQV